MEIREPWPQTLVKVDEMSERKPAIKMLQLLEVTQACSKVNCKRAIEGLAWGLSA